MKHFKISSNLILIFFIAFIISYPLNALTQDEETFLDAAIFGDFDVIEKLLEKKVNVNVRDNVGNTALILASIEGRTEVVEILIKANAKKDILNKHGKSALDYAKERKRKDIIKILEN